MIVNGGRIRRMSTPTGTLLSAYAGFGDDAAPTYNSVADLVNDWKTKMTQVRAQVGTTDSSADIDIGSLLDQFIGPVSDAVIANPDDQSRIAAYVQLGNKLLADSSLAGVDALLKAQLAKFPATPSDMLAMVVQKVVAAASAAAGAAGSAALSAFWPLLLIGGAVLWIKNRR